MYRFQAKDRRNTCILWYKSSLNVPEYRTTGLEGSNQEPWICADIIQNYKLQKRTIREPRSTSPVDSQPSERAHHGSGWPIPVPSLREPAIRYSCLKKNTTCKFVLSIFVRKENLQICYRIHSKTEHENLLESFKIESNFHKYQGREPVVS